MARKVSNNILSGLYRPEYEPIVDTLNEAEFDPEAIAEAVEQEIAKKTQEAEQAIRTTGSDVSSKKKLTPFEAEALDRHIDELEDAIDATRSRISKFKEYIDDQVRDPNGGELSFSVSLAKKPALKRAVIGVFGKKVNTITYSMYLEARAAKKLIEEQQSDEYLKGEWSE